MCEYFFNFVIVFIFDAKSFIEALLEHFIGALHHV